MHNPKNLKEKTYLKISVGDNVMRIFNITNESVRKIYRYVDNLPKSVTFEFIVTERDIKCGKQY